MWLGKRVCKEEPMDAPAEECLKTVKEGACSKKHDCRSPSAGLVFHRTQNTGTDISKAKRINDPSDPHNQWRFRIDICLEDLIEDKAFSNRIRKLIAESGKRIDNGTIKKEAATMTAPYFHPEIIC